MVVWIRNKGVVANRVWVVVKGESESKCEGGARLWLLELCSEGKRGFCDGDEGLTAVKKGCEGL